MAHSNMARGVEQNVAKQFNRFIRYDYNLKNRSSWTEDQNNVKHNGGPLFLPKKKNSYDETPRF